MINRKYFPLRPVLRKIVSFRLSGELGKVLSFLLKGEVVFLHFKLVVFNRLISFPSFFFGKVISFPSFKYQKSKKQFS